MLRGGACVQASRECNTAGAHGLSSSTIASKRALRPQRDLRCQARRASTTHPPAGAHPFVIASLHHHRGERKGATETTAHHQRACGANVGGAQCLSSRRQQAPPCFPTLCVTPRTLSTMGSGKGGGGGGGRQGGGGCVARVQAEAAPPSPEHGPSCNRTDVFRRCALGTKGRGDNSRRMKREGVPLPQANLPTQQHHGTRPRKGKWQRCRGKVARGPGKGSLNPGDLKAIEGGGNKGGA